MVPVYPNIQSQFPYFLSLIEKQSWDYHFATIPLTKFRVPKQIVASKYDTNRGSSWVPPYPGASLSSISDNIDSSYFQLPLNYTEFIGLSDINRPVSGVESGFSNIKSELLSGFGTSRFLRSDAMLAVVVVGNGNDTSGINLCTRTDGVIVPCSDDSTLTSLTDYQNWFKAFKSNFKWISYVANQNSENCLGGPSSIGARYQAMAQFLGGYSGFDFCSFDLSRVINYLQPYLIGDLKSLTLGRFTITQDADPSTIQFTRYPGGDVSHGVVVPQDSENGWTYLGKVTQVNSIVLPVEETLISGYVVQLNGSARLTGDDTGSIQYKPAGAKNSVGN